MASWGCLGASGDRKHYPLEVQGLKGLIFEGFNKVGVGEATAAGGISGPLRGTKERRNGLNGSKGGGNGLDSNTVVSDCLTALH